MIARMGLRWGCALLGAWLSVGVGYAQSGTLRGKIKEHGTGLLLDGVTVVLQDSSSTALARISSGPEGRYEFADVPPGTYSLILDLGGYEPYKCAGVGVRSKTITFVDVNMRKPSSEAHGGKKNVRKWRRHSR